MIKLFKKKKKFYFRRTPATIPNSASKKTKIWLLKKLTRSLSQKPKTISSNLLFLFSYLPIFKPNPISCDPHPPPITTTITPPMLVTHRTLASHPQPQVCQLFSLILFLLPFCLFLTLWLLLLNFCFKFLPLACSNFSLVCIWDRKSVV